MEKGVVREIIVVTGQLHFLSYYSPERKKNRSETLMFSLGKNSQNGREIPGFSMLLNQSLWKHWHLVMLSRMLGSCQLPRSIWVMLKILWYVCLVNCRCLAVKVEKAQICSLNIVVTWIGLQWLEWKLRANNVYYQLIYFLFGSVSVQPNIWVKNKKP